MAHIFHFLPTSLVFEIVNPFSWIFNAISSDKSCLISSWRQDTRIFPACWILIGQFKFPARQPYARILLFNYCVQRSGTQAWFGPVAFRSWCPCVRYNLDNPHSFPHSCKETKMGPPLDVLQGHVTASRLVLYIKTRPVNWYRNYVMWDMWYGMWHVRLSFQAWQA